MKYQDLKKFSEMLSRENDHLKQKNREYQKQTKTNNSQLSVAFEKIEDLKAKIRLQHAMAPTPNGPNHVRKEVTAEDFKTILDPDKAENQTITVIKSIRTMTGWGLKETKVFFEDNIRAYHRGEISLDQIGEGHEPFTPKSDDSTKPDYKYQDAATLGSILKDALKGDD